MDLEKINLLIEMLEGTDITEIDIEEENFNIKIKKGIKEKTVISQNDLKPKPEQIVSESNKKVNKQDEEEKLDADNIEEIESPMVGTFYRAPAPDADPFVEAGDTVQKGDTLCIIEAMKLMNEIEAEKQGKIKEILVEDSESVEYGQSLFIIETD